MSKKTFFYNRSGMYTPSGAISITANNQIVSGLDITVSGGAVGISSSGSYDNVKIQKCRIHWRGAYGIHLTGFTNLEISDCDFVFTGATSGDIGTETNNCFRLYGCNGAQILRNRVTGGNGPFFDTMSNHVCQYIQCTNMQGSGASGYGGGIAHPNCTNPSLLDFYIKNDLNKAWTGDNINLYNCTGGTISRGLIDGNNCYNGACIQLQNDSSVNVDNVDGINWHQQGFSVANALNCTYTSCRAGYNLGNTLEQGRGTTSGATPPAFANENYGSNSTGTVWTSCGYYIPTAPSSIYWEDTGCTHTGTLTNLGAFTPRTPYIWVPVYA